MTSLTRRTLGKAALATPLAVAAGTAGAQTPATQGAALYDAPLGDYQITAILDGIAPLGRGFFFGEDAAAIDATLAQIGVGPDVLPAPVSAYLLRSADRTILIDAGMGGLDILGPGFGRLSASLAVLGVDPQDVDTVILTHAHPDHLGGLIANDAAVFGAAELVVAEAEVAFWTDDAMMAQAPEEAQGLFALVRGTLGAYGDQVTQVASGTEVAPGVTLQVSPGHTPGHAVLRIDGGAQQLMMIADTVHSADLHLAMPDVGFGFDVDAGLAAQSRRQLFDEINADKLLVAGSHIHFPGFGRILKAGDGYRFAPATWI